MSTYTSNLNLFKYNVITDAKVPFSITQALNDNWDKIDEIATDLNAKANLDLSNTVGNISASANAYFGGLFLPTETYTTLTVAASGSQYVAPTDGYFFAYTNPTNTGRVHIGLADEASGFGLWSWANSGEPMSIFIPARKGLSVTFRYLNANNIIFRFYPVKGSIN